MCALKQHSEELVSSDADDQIHAVLQHSSIHPSQSAQSRPSVDNQTILQSAKLNSPSPSKSIRVKVPVKSLVFALKGQQQSNTRSDLQSKPCTRRTLKLLAQDAEDSVNVTLECPSSFTTFQFILPYFWMMIQNLLSPWKK